MMDGGKIGRIHGRGGPCRMRSRMRTVASGAQGTSKLQPKRHGSIGSIHQVTPALA